MKIIATALFMVILLSKSLSRMQWIAIFILAAGVALVQVDSASGKEGSHYNYPVGLAAICVSCLCSGFAGECTVLSFIHTAFPSLQFNLTLFS